MTDHQPFPPPLKCQLMGSRSHQHHMSRDGLLWLPNGTPCGGTMVTFVFPALNKDGYLGRAANWAGPAAGSCA